jgi:hypothetical protein
MPASDSKPSTPPAVRGCDAAGAAGLVSKSRQARWQMIARQAVRRPDDEQVIAAKAALAATSAKTAAPAAAAPAE